MGKETRKLVKRQEMKKYVTYTSLEDEIPNIKIMCQYATALRQRTNNIMQSMFEPFITAIFPEVDSGLGCYFLGRYRIPVIYGERTEEILGLPLYAVLRLLDFPENAQVREEELELYYLRGYRINDIIGHIAATRPGEKYFTELGPAVSLFVEPYFTKVFKNILDLGESLELPEAPIREILTVPKLARRAGWVSGIYVKLADSLGLLHNKRARAGYVNVQAASELIDKIINILKTYLTALDKLWTLRDFFMLLT